MCETLMEGIFEKPLEQGWVIGPGDESEWGEKVNCYCVGGTECVFFLVLVFFYFIWYAFNSKRVVF